MKKISLIFALFAAITFTTQAQAPQAFKYQAVARDNMGNTLANQTVSFRISILQGSSSGTSVYSESHTTTTNPYGLANLNIGAGTVISGTFAAISWGTNNYFIKVEMDPAGGSAYALMGTTQLLSVPYALYAETSGSSGATGNSVTEVAGTAQLVVTSATTTYTLIPGLSTTINVPAGCKVIVHTDGGLQCTTTGVNFSAVDIGIFVDGTVSASGGQRRIIASNTDALGQMVASWSFDRTYTLAAGSHTFQARAMYVGGSTANVSSGSAPQIQGVLTVTVIKL
jgi:hypothetical protein